MKPYLLLFAVFMFCVDIANSQTPAAGETVAYYGKDNGAALSNPLMGWQCYCDLEEIIQHGIEDV
jgi:hypothetical protein